MFVRAYLRASTDEQDANRARKAVSRFAEDAGHTVAAWYVENASGASTDRPELRRLIADASRGDVLLVESIDRLSRLTSDDWKALRGEIEAKGLRVVALDLPLGHVAMTAGTRDDFTGRMLDAVNGMMLDVLAAIARKDYEQRRERQMQGVERAKAEGKYRGRRRDTAKREQIRELLGAGFSVRKAASIAGASPSTVQSVKKEMREDESGAS